MDTKTGRVSYPHSVLSWYLKLFCKRRNTKTRMVEGIQSWLTLSKSEKQQLFMKYKECRLNHKLKLANYLKKVKPYMKRKDIKRVDTEKHTKHTETKLETDKETVNELEEQNSNLNIENVPNNEEHFDTSRNNNEIVYDQDYSSVGLIQQSRTSSLSRENSRPILAEPAPPSVKTGRELFEMIKDTSDNNVMNDTWATLPNLQKNRYQRAVQKLKNEYLQKYKAYLESLPSKELYNVYNNFFD